MPVIGEDGRDVLLRRPPSRLRIGERPSARCSIARDQGRPAPAGRYREHQPAAGRGRLSEIMRLCSCHAISRDGTARCVHGWPLLRRLVSEAPSIDGDDRSRQDQNPHRPNRILDRRRRAARRQGGQPQEAERELYATRQKIHPEAGARHLPHDQVDRDGGDARHLLRPAVAALESRAGSAESGRPARHGEQPLLLLLPRDLAAGILLRHRPAGAGGAAAVPGHRARRSRLVRLHLSADGVDRPDDFARAVLAGRPQRADQARQGAVGRFQDLQEGR